MLPLKAVLLWLILITVFVVLSVPLLSPFASIANVLREYGTVVAPQSKIGSRPSPMSTTLDSNMEREREDTRQSHTLITDDDALWTNAKKEGFSWRSEDQTLLEAGSYWYLQHPETVNGTYDVWRTQKLRRKVLQETCDGLGELKASSAPGHLLVDDRNRFLFCEVRKVASIAWRRVLDIMSSANDSSAAAGSPHRRARKSRLRRLSTYTATERERRLHDYTKFLFVREPMLRLVSGWRDKFVAGPQRRDYLSSWGPRIKRYYHSHQKQSSSPIDTGQQPSVTSLGDLEITFPEFVKYLTAGPSLSPLMRDMHWQTYRSRCLPCLVRYDFVGHYETLGSDAAAILRVLDLRGRGGHSVDFPISRSDSLEVAREEFPKLTPKDLSKLARLYDLDYKLFGYSMSRFLRWLQKNMTAIL